MNLKKIVISSALIVSPVIFAGDYQSEVGIDHFNFDGGSITALTGRYHFERVSTSNTVLAEASFYSRENNVFAELSTGDLDSKQIGAEFYLNNFYIAPTYTTVELFGENEGAFGVDLGYSPFNGLRFSTFLPESDYDANLSAKYVTTLGNGRTINLEATLVDDNSSVGGDYYFDKTMSVGLRLGEDVVTLSADKFFTDTLKGGVSYTDTDGANVIGLDVAWRF